MSYFIQRKIVPLFVRWFLGKVTGIELLPKKGGAIVVSNHASYLDHFLVGGVVVKYSERMVYFLAKKEHFETFFQRKWHEFLKAIPVDRQAGGHEALKHAIEHLKKGDLIMIYPEGTRSLTGKINQGKTGAVRLALAANVPIIPIGISNTFKILPKGKIIPRFGIKANIQIGEKISYENHIDPDGKEITKNLLRKLTDDVMKKISELSGIAYDP